MSTQEVASTEVRSEAPSRRESARAYAIASVGPLTVTAGIVWALLQPYRITILDPAGQGFWALAVEGPMLVVLVGVIFHFLVVPGVLADLEKGESDDAAP
jgi:hypothetical protein